MTDYQPGDTIKLTRPLGHHPAGTPGIVYSHPDGDLYITLIADYPDGTRNRVQLPLGDAHIELDQPASLNWRAAAHASQCALDHIADENTRAPAAPLPPLPAGQPDPYEPTYWKAGDRLVALETMRRVHAGDIGTITAINPAGIFIAWDNGAVGAVPNDNPDFSVLRLNITIHS